MRDGRYVFEAVSFLREAEDRIRLMGRDTRLDPSIQSRAWAIADRLEAIREDRVEPLVIQAARQITTDDEEPVFERPHRRVRKGVVIALILAGAVAAGYGIGSRIAAGQTPRAGLTYHAVVAASVPVPHKAVNPSGASERSERARPATQPVQPDSTSQSLSPDPIWIFESKGGPREGAKRRLWEAWLADPSHALPTGYQLTCQPVPYVDSEDQPCGLTPMMGT